MCGISALVGAPDRLAAQHVVAMTRLAGHRGPDGEGFLALCDSPLEPKRFDAATAQAVRGARVLFGHRRLAIVDLSESGSQPMASADGEVWITYNGEVYNHPELRAQLEQIGHRFMSRSDTEVILAAYRQWGVDCLQRFNGMFAFVLVDRRRRLVWAVRDRFGVKPLYWWRAPNGVLAFASEIKQFTLLPGWRARLNGPRARDFLITGAYEHTDETLFEGVRQLRGGEMLRLVLDPPAEPRIDRWYDLRPRPFTGTFAEAKAGFRELLTDAVRLRLRADVAVGSCLSGGLDSSAIVCLTSRLRGGADGTEPQLAFSALSDSPRYDERRYAQAVAQRAAINLYTVTPRAEDLVSALDPLVWSQDEPIGSTSIFAQSEVFRLAAEQKVKVMLDGQGADETLGGYPVFRAVALAELAVKLRLFRLLQELRVAAQGSLRLLARALAPTAAVALVRSRISAEAEAWFDHSRLGLAAGASLPMGDAAARRDFRALSREQVLTSSLPALLHWEDRSSMAHGVEARVPFLDYRLVEFVLGLPTEAKFQAGVAKRLLREALQDVLPEAVFRRTDKLGFQLAEDEWARERPDMMRRLLADSVADSGGLIRPGILALFDQFVTGARPYTFLFWRVISFARWMRRFEVSLA